MAPQQGDAHRNQPVDEKADITGEIGAKRYQGWPGPVGDRLNRVSPRRWTAMTWRGPSLSWQPDVVQRMQFEARVMTVGRDRVIVPVPFDPDQVWGDKPRHHVAGTVNAMRVRAVLEAVEGGVGFVLGPAWRRDCGVASGDLVEVRIEPEGPQRGELPADLAAALDADPVAGQFFDSLAQFYRNAYLKWISATRRSPALRAERIAVVVQLLVDGKKTRPNPQ